MKHNENKTEMQFLRTEALSGLTFSKIALESQDREKIERNRANARKAYDSLLHFMPRVSAGDEAWEDLGAKFALLKAQLQQLGEDV